MREQRDHVRTAEAGVRQLWGADRLPPLRHLRRLLGELPMSAMTVALEDGRRDRRARDRRPGGCWLALGVPAALVAVAVAFASMELTVAGQFYALLGLLAST